VRAEVAIVGNGVGGFACAARLAQHGVRALLIGPGLPIDRPPLSKSALVKGEHPLLADRERLAERGIAVLDGIVEHADLGARRLGVGEIEVTADVVVLATGLSYAPPPIPGLGGAHVNATPAGCAGLTAALAAGAQRVVVVGGGLVGVETALTLAGLGHGVTIVDALPRPVDRLHAPLPDLVAGFLEEAGVAFVGEAPLEEVVDGVRATVVRHARGELEADVVVAATGGRSVLPPGLDAGLLADDGTLRVVEGGRIPGLERVHAAGDLVTLPHARWGAIRFPQWDAAVGSGEHVADAIAGVGGPYTRLPYWWSDLGSHRVAEVGWAGAAVTWAAEDGLSVGRDPTGAIAAVLIVDAPRRVREARALVGA
jgi:3-phenylpropionate/trans-cinnamate dioxygenase ferredoxin reductase subunit